MTIRLMVLFVLALGIGLSDARADYRQQPAAADIERRLMQLCALLPDNDNCRGILPAQCESDDGDKCVCGRGKVCEATETSCACFKAQDGAGAGRLMPSITFGVQPPPPQLATIDVKCGSDTYTISTGNDSGSCTATPLGTGGGGGGSCTDGAGNGAKASCDTGCTSADGAGSCTGP